MHARLSSPYHLNKLYDGTLCTTSKYQIFTQTVDCDNWSTVSPASTLHQPLFIMLQHIKLMMRYTKSLSLHGHASQKLSVFIRIHTNSSWISETLEQINYAVDHDYAPWMLGTCMYLWLDTIRLQLFILDSYTCSKWCMYVYREKVLGIKQNTKQYYHRKC